LAEIWHTGRGPLWPQNIKNLLVGNSCNSFKYFLKFRTLAHISKMASKTTSGSDFDFRFVFCALYLVKNEYNIEGVPRTLFEIFEAKVQKFKKSVNELQMTECCNFLIFCSRCGSLSLCQTLAKSLFRKLLRPRLKFSDLSFFRPHFSTKFSATNFDGQYLRKDKT